jgi:hypothetical protein
MEQESSNEYVWPHVVTPSWFGFSERWYPSVNKGLFVTITYQLVQPYCESRS